MGIIYFKNMECSVKHFSTEYINEHFKNIFLLLYIFKAKESIVLYCLKAQNITDKF